MGNIKGLINVLQTREEEFNVLVSRIWAVLVALIVILLTLSVSSGIHLAALLSVHLPSTVSILLLLLLLLLLRLLPITLAVLAAVILGHLG